MGARPPVYPELFALTGANVPDYRGLFLRGHGSQVHVQENGSEVGVTATTHSSGPLGSVQGDAMRNLTGRTNNFQEASYAGGSPDGAFSSTAFGTGWGGSRDTNAVNHTTYLDASRTVPTASENRPANVAVRYLIRAKP
jgi:hypothetical protein